MYQKYQAKAGLTVEKQTITETIQAAMRARQLLWADAQRVLWILLEALHQEINPNKPFDQKALAYWMIRNEAEIMKIKLEARAYQGIQQIIISHIWKLVDRDPSLYDVYKDALEEKTLFDISKIYEIESSEIKTRKALMAFAEELCSRFKMDIYDFPRQGLERIDTIIEQTEKFLDQIYSPHGAELGAEVFQEQHAEANKEQENKQETELLVNLQYQKANNFRFNEERYREEDVLREGFLSDAFMAQSENYRFYSYGDLGIKAPLLIIRSNDLSPLAGLSSDEATKPIRQLLVRIDQEGRYRFLACTAAAAEFYQEEFLRMKIEGISLDVKYALVGFDNHILCASHSLTKGEKERLMTSHEVNKMTVYAAFLNGEIKDPYILKEIIEDHQWNLHDYRSIVNKIVTRHVSSAPVQLVSGSIIERLCFFN